MTTDELAEIGALTQQAMRVTRAVSGPDGFNLGVNQGAVAGAGIAAHLHQHVVPRWSGDANFLPVVAQTKAVPQLLDQAWELLHAAWSRDAAARRRAPDAGALPGRRGPADRPAGPVPQPPRGLARIWSPRSAPWA